MRMLPLRFTFSAVVMTVLAGISYGAATLVETDVDVAGTPVPCYVMENPYLQVAIRKSDGRTIGIIKKTDPGIGTNQTRPSDYPAYLDRVNQKNPTGQAFTVNPNGDDSADKVSLKVSETIDTTAGITFAVTKLYELRDNSKVLETTLSFTNNDAQVAWEPANPQNGLESIVYALAGGATPSGNEAQLKTALGIDAVTSGTLWWGGAPTGTTPRPEVTDGYVAFQNKINNVYGVVTWDLPSQQAHGVSGVSVTKLLISATSRYQFEPIYVRADGGETVAWKQNFIVDDDMAVVSGVTPDAVAGIIPANPSYPQGSTATVAFRINSINRSMAKSYDIKDIQLIDVATSAVAKTATNITNVAVASNAHVLAGTKQFNLTGLAVGAYVVKATLTAAGDGTVLSTLMSKPIMITAADVKVQLYQDTGTGNWILENEVLRSNITANGEITTLELKDAENRNQVNSSYNLFRDYVRPLGSSVGFTGYYATADPNGTDTPTRKSILFANGYNAYGDASKLFTLESTSRSLQADLTYTSQLPDTLTGQGFFSHCAMAPGGSGNANDRFTARGTSGLLTPHTASQRIWYGYRPPAQATTELEDVELTEPWMATTDTVVTDAIAITWDRTKQLEFSSIPEGGTNKVTLNSVFQASSFNRHIGEAHFTNIPGYGTVSTTMHVLAGSGFKLVGYAEAKRVMAGIWPNAAEVPAGSALSFSVGLTNTGTTERTFDIKNIAIVKSTGEPTTGPTDETGIVLAASAHTTKDLNFLVPVGQSQEAYVLSADLYEGTTKVATLTSLPFTVTQPVIVANGDVDGSGIVDGADALLALKIAAGLSASDADQIGRGDIFPDPGDKALTIEDATAIARKVDGL